MVIFATNAPEQFDWAVNSRIDEVVEFPLPDLSERVRLVRQYFYEYVLLPASTKKQRIRLEIGDSKIDWESKCNDIARITEGLSGRDIAKIAVDWQASAYSSDEGLLTEKMMDQIVDEAIDAYNKKEEWRKYKLPTAVKADSQQAIMPPIESSRLEL